MTDKEDKISKIEEISNSVRPKEIEEEIEAPARTSPNKDQFDALMNLDQQRAPTVVRTEAAEKVSLMDQIRDINHKVDSVSRASPEQLVAQAQDVIKQIEDVKTHLVAPDLELKDSVQSLMKSKLTHIDESLKVALNRAGIEYTPQDLGGEKASLITPIERFIGFLTHGQYQLQRLATDVEMMHLNSAQMSPASMLAIQIKVGYIQQEVEFFANMLNKALESTKTIMNVQI